MTVNIYTFDREFMSFEISLEVVTLLVMCCVDPTALHNNRAARKVLANQTNPKTETGRWGDSTRTNWQRTRVCVWVYILWF